MHPSEQLSELLEKVAPYPVGVVPLPGRLGGTGFFPGGAGVWGAVRGNPLPELQAPAVMVLGHNLDSVMGYSASLERDQESMKGPTWRQLISLLQEVEIGLDQCFFTNFYMGLKAVGNSTGPFPGASDEAYVQRCREFFVEQVRLIRPTVILILGLEVPHCLAQVSPRFAGWLRAKKFVEFDSMNLAVLHEVEIADVSGISAVVLSHPCHRHLNAKFRRFNSATGHEAEIAMVREAMEGIGE